MVYAYRRGCTCSKWGVDCDLSQGKHGALCWTKLETHGASYRGCGCACACVPVDVPVVVPVDVPVDVPVCCAKLIGF